MKNLTDNLTKLTSTTQYKKDAERVPPCIANVINLIRTNRFNDKNIVHRQQLALAISKGYVDHNLNILKEV